MTFLNELAKSAAWGLVALIVFSICGFGAYWWLTDASMSISDGTCNVAVIPLHGDITSYVYYDEFGYEVSTSVLDDVEYMLRSAEDDSNIKAVLLSVDSYGGSPYAGEAIAEALKRSSLPSVAVVRDIAASAAYWAATGADRVFASALSSVGSIGVTMSYVERVRQNEDSGLDYIEISSAPYKDAGSPDRFLSDEERALFQTDVDVMHSEFVRQVAENRGLPLESVQELADGNTRLGTDALTLGLIDELGNKESARAWLASELSMKPEDVIYCE